MAAESDALVSAEGLNAILQNDNVVVVDVRGEAAYEAGHIPGAVNLNLDTIYETVGGINKMAATPATFAAVLSELGISNGDTVVACGDGTDMKSVTRLWWTLKLYNHADAKVLDGGVQAWEAAGYEVSTEAVTPEAAEYVLTEADLDQDAVATIAEVKAALDNDNAVIIDARDMKYYSGAVTKAARSGHVAGAILIPSADLYNEDGTFKSAEDLTELYASYGVAADNDIYVFCNTGTISTQPYFALTQILGYESVQNFDASMTGWAADPLLPVERDTKLLNAAALNELDDVVLVDVRPAEAYDEGHIPGAVNLDLNTIYETVGGINKMAATPATFAAVLGELGISNGDTVVACGDAGDMKSVTRFWWTLALYGHANAYVLDGGVQAWEAAGFDLSTEAVTPEAAEYVLTDKDRDEGAVATMDEVKAALDNEEAVIVDTRDQNYYSGKTYKTARNGHIAGAILVPAGDLFNEDGTFKSAAELTEICVENGVLPTNNVYVFCNTGTISSQAYFALTEILGYANAENFDASMTGWSTDETLPGEASYHFFNVGSDAALVNSNNVTMAGEVFIVNDRSMIPAKALANALGAELTVDGDSIVLTKGDVVVELSVGEASLAVNGEAAEIDVAPTELEDNLYLPVRHVAEAFGAEVGWDAETKGISVGF